MKLKLIAISLLFSWVSCSSPEEKKKENETEEVEADEAPVEEEIGYEEEVIPEEVETPEEVIEDLKESNKGSQKTNSSNPFPNDQRGMGVGEEGSGNGSGEGMGSGIGVTKKSIDVKNDITVGEEGVR